LKCIVADSSPLIAFGRSGLLGLLNQVLGSILVPTTAFLECTRDTTKPGASALTKAEADGLLDVRKDSDANHHLGNLPSLDAGEISALALALDQQCLLLMDERLGRNVARLHKIPVVGSAGILLTAKERGFATEIAPILTAWRPWGYFLSPQLIQTSRF
jgi:predicted nucleic acid-binding protein